MERRFPFAPARAERQRDALRGQLTKVGNTYRTRSGKKLNDIATDLGINYNTLWKYVDGRTPLGFEQTAAFAKQFEMTEAELIRACFPEVASPVASREALLARMHGAGIPAERIAKVETVMIDKPLEDQAVLVEEEILDHREAQAPKQIPKRARQAPKARARTRANG